MSSVPQKAIKHKMDLLNWANEPGNDARPASGGSFWPALAPCGCAEPIILPPLL